MAKSLGQAIITAKCPRCREGDLFPVSLFSFRKLTDINHSCKVCNSTFQPEPRFFDGAMYISYAFSVALVITVFVAINVLIEKPELWMYLSTIVVINTVFLPVMLRYSKVLYLYGVGKLKYRGH
ncbi:MAG: DUF983 domain-containing protein [Bacteroidota bacterium]|uniref:DUF983 domain-containing protein n=1 Tax=Algoriphagus faecimaris TaxID=686796 RepID=A0A1G6PGK4_9BACT|nr:DUF983 domain-containing protein [Algoriphagus faecimaris]SDC79360.1 Protein of unknown function [Algoriphagus faecimaris]